MNTIIAPALADTLVLHYRPQANIRAGTVAGFDLHAISAGPGCAAVDYATFVQAVEADPRAVELVDKLLQAVCADAAALAQAAAQVLPVTLALPAVALADARLPDRLARLLGSLQLPAHSLCVGVAAAMASRGDLADALAGFRRAGFPLVLLDVDPERAVVNTFSGGLFHAAQVALAASALASRFGSAALAAAVNVAHAADMRVLARYVDGEDLFELARRCEVDAVQGELLGPPLPSAALVDYVRDPCKLPPHLTERRRAPRNLLLVDDETNIVSALKRLLRRDSYTIHTASSGQEGLDILAGQQIDVIVSDQRMPGMTGVEFLRQAKQLYPDTTRIVLSGYSELQSVVAAVNEGAVYKFLMKPWDDEQLREHISDAFRRKEMEDENRRLDLELKQANSALSATNRRLEEVLVQQHKRIELDEISLDVAREALDLVPVPVLALDIENVIAYMNAAAVVLFQDGAALLGSDAAHSLPEVAAALASAGAGAGEPGTARIGGQEYRLAVRRMGLASRSRGWIVTLLHQCEPGA